MIKLKDILIEAMSKNEIMDVVNKVYPYIVKDLGGKKLKVEVHSSIWHRVGAVGAEELMEDDNPAAQYDWDKKKIYVYYSGAKNIQEIIRSLLHEHTHSLQNKKKFDAGYDSGKYTYKTHPYEKAATRSESNWKKYLKHLKVDENFRDGKVKGKSRPGRVKRAGASCKGSVTDLRAKAKNASGEKAKMYHWCANMKSGKK